MHFILTGGGDSEHFYKIDKYFINSLNETSNLLYIPHAQELEIFNEGLARIRANFSTIEFDHIEMCTDLANLNMEYLAKFDAIYIDGGNTFRLMSEIRNTHTFELFHHFLNRGGIINGDSAGAIILGSHLETAHFGSDGDDNDEEDVISYQGLNFFGKYAVHCHYNDSEDQEIFQFSNTYGFPILALNEKCSVVVQDNKISVMGKWPLSIFKEGHKIEILVGESYLL